MQVILNVPDKGYVERTWYKLLWTYLIKVMLNVPDKVILNVPDKGYVERTW